jgi:hypothetical protein
MRPEFPIGKLTFLQVFEMYRPAMTSPFCDLCLVKDVVERSKYFYKDDDNNGWALCEKCVEELELEGVI